MPLNKKEHLIVLRQDDPLVIERWMAKTEEYEAGFEELFDSDERLAEYADAVSRLREEAVRLVAWYREAT